MGRSRGELTSKVHLLSDDRARPLHWLISPGQRGDSPMFAAVLDGLRIRRRGTGRPRSRPDRVRGDKAYSSRDNRDHPRRRGIKATIAQTDDQRLHRISLSVRASTYGMSGACSPDGRPSPTGRAAGLEPARNRRPGSRVMA